MVWEYLNTKFLKKIPQDTLLAHRTSLPISQDTAWNWMIKCGAGCMGFEKTYYNDHHENPEVVLFREKLFKL